MFKVTQGHRGGLTYEKGKCLISRIYICKVTVSMIERHF